jgi:hypothetical protein
MRFRKLADAAGIFAASRVDLSGGLDDQLVKPGGRRPTIGDLHRAFAEFGVSTLPLSVTTASRGVDPDLQRLQSRLGRTAPPSLCGDRPIVEHHRRLVGGILRRRGDVLRRAIDSGLRFAGAPPIATRTISASPRPTQPR